MVCLRGWRWTIKEEVKDVENRAIPAATCICSNSVKEGFCFNVKFSYLLVLYNETAFTSWLLAYINETE